MKNTIVTYLVILSGLIFFAGCEKNESTTIKVIEGQIFNEIKAHRIDNGISSDAPFVHQFIMVKEAQLFSAKMAYGTGGLDTTGISAHWDMIHDKIGGYNDLTLIQATSQTSAADIVGNWTNDSTISAMMLDEFSQCGVGVEYGNDNVAYVTVLMMLID
ncbi:MAG: hypothetical protein WD578_08270 [Bacteroidales bacterium]